MQFQKGKRSAAWKGGIVVEKGYVFIKNNKPNNKKELGKGGVCLTGVRFLEQSAVSLIN
jgi:hypothetical protein